MFLSSFSAVAKADGFSAYSMFSQEGADTVHSTSRARLGQSILSYGQMMMMIAASASNPYSSPESRSLYAGLGHKRASLGDND